MSKTELMKAINKELQQKGYKTDCGDHTIDVDKNISYICTIWFDPKEAIVCHIMSKLGEFEYADPAFPENLYKRLEEL